MEKILQSLTDALNPKCDRRTFLKTSAALAGTATVGGLLLKEKTAVAGHAGAVPDTVDSDKYAILYSTCQMCHGRCGLMATIDKTTGALLKLDGNPYNAQNMDPDEQVPFATDPAANVSQSGHPYDGKAVKTIRGRMCPRGQAGIQSIYNPYRLTSPVKRVGPRGSGRWQPISWATAISEIATQIDTLIPFATRNSDNISTLSELGKIANGLVVSPGRSIEGQIWERIFKLGYGTANWRLDHTSICEESHHIACMMASSGTSTSGKKHFHADHAESKYVVIIGANPLEANFAMVPLARGIVNMKKNGGKLVVVDPRFSPTASKADLWLPIKPGTEGAFAMGLASYIIDNKLTGTVRETYLKNASKAAATADNEPTYCDATWLVITASDTATDVGKFLSPSLLTGTGLTTERYTWASSAISTAFDPTSTSVSAEGELTPGEVVPDPTNKPNLKCKTVFELYKAEVTKKSTAEWATVCGLTAAQLSTVGEGLTDSANGRKTAIWSYRGAVQHANGTTNELCIQSVVTLIGNVDYRGGMTGAAGGSDENKTSGVDSSDLKKFGTGLTPLSPTGPRLDRAGNDYHTYTNLVASDGYPASRPWFPFASLGNFQEVIPGIQDQYPYPVKVLITYWNAFPYSVPALKKVFEETASDETLLPLFVAIDPIIGENSAWADYILPDTTYLEKWSIPHGGNAGSLVKNEPIQQPVVGRLDGNIIGSVAFDPNATNAYVSFLGANGPKMAIDIVRDLAAALKRTDGSTGLMGVGPNAFADDGSFDRAWDLAKRLLGNFAANASSTITEVCAKGGSFMAQDQAYTDGPTATTIVTTGSYISKNARFGGARRLYIEPLVTTKSWYDGNSYFTFGVPRWEAAQHLDGTTIDDGTGYPFRLITYKSVHHGQARTHVNPWLMGLQPENWIEVSATDAETLGVSDGDFLRMYSVSNPDGTRGKVKVRQGLRPGVVAVSHHFGHWEGGARPQALEFNEDVPSANYAYLNSAKSEAWRGSGLTANPTMRADKLFPNVTVQDRLGGSCAFNDTQVALVKVSL